LGSLSAVTTDGHTCDAHQQVGLRDTDLWWRMDGTAACVILTGNYNL